MNFIAIIMTRQQYSDRNLGKVFAKTTAPYLFKCTLLSFSITRGPGRKLRKLGNLGKLGNFFPRFLNRSFRFWLQGKIENLEIRKLGIIFPRFPSFQFATFHFSKNFFFSIFYSRQFRTFYLCYVLFSKPFKVFFPLPKIYVQNITFEVNENFSRFPSFRFWVQGKIENSETSHFFFSKHIIKLTFFILGYFSVSFQILCFIYYQKYK